MLNLARHGGFAALLVGVAALALWLWGLGGATQITLWAAAEQREVQSALAQALRAVRGGEEWAVLGLLALCFAYGFVHAAGPGHGKLVMGGYALGEAVPRGRLIALTLAGALGQATTAILLVSFGALVFGWGRAQMTDLADRSLAAASMAAIALVGLWLVWRGLRRWWRVPQSTQVCASCGHAHGPDPSAVAQAHSWRDAVAIVLSISIRPCTGALFLLILTFSMGIPLIGAFGALVMGLGTAVLTLGVALGASGLRGGLAARLDGPVGLRVMAGLEVLAGSAVALIASQAALRFL